MSDASLEDFCLVSTPGNHVKPEVTAECLREYLRDRQKEFSILLRAIPPEARHLSYFDYIVSIMIC